MEPITSVTLPDGTLVTANPDVRVRDLYDAEIACQIKYKDEKGAWQEKTDQVKLKYAMMSAMLLFNGQHKFVDDLMNLKMSDLNLIAPLLEEHAKGFQAAQTA